MYGSKGLLKSEDKRAQTKSDLCGNEGTVMFETITQKFSKMKNRLYGTHVLLGISKS